MPDFTGAAICLGVLGMVAFIIALALRQQRGRNTPRRDTRMDNAHLESLLTTDAPVLSMPSWSRRNYHEPPKAALSLGEAAQMLQEAPHIAILGATGDGKTTLGEALLRLLPGPFTVIDPNWVPDKWSGLPCATLDEDGNWGQIQYALHAIDTEISRRRLAAREGSATTSTLTILWDEVNEVIEDLKTASEKLRRWLRTARQFGVKLIIFPQSDRVVELGFEGRGDARRHLLWVYVGDDARRKAAKALSPSDAQTVMDLEYPGIVRWHEQLYIVDLEGAADLAHQPLPKESAWNPSGKEAQGVSTPSPAPPSVTQTKVAGVDDVGPFLVLARLLKAEIVTSETPLIEAAFVCGAGGGVIYQTARERLRYAKSQLAIKGGDSDNDGTQQE